MYRLTNTDSVVRIEGGAIIPADPENIDYAAYLRWADEGNAPEPYVVPFDRTAAVVKLKNIRALVLNALAGLMGDALADDDTPMVGAIKVARQGVKDITSYPALAAATNDAEFEAAAKARYKELVDAAPPFVKTAFRDAT